jgi:glucosamine--fructose-6-phosphate aminotransferase (isomerizing)
VLRARIEIAEQPGVVARLLDREHDAIDRLAREVRERRPPFAVIAARGTSDNAARYAQHLFGRLLGLPVVLATPSLHTLYDAPPRLGGALVLGISQSGSSPDVVRVLTDAAAQGATTAAITNDPASPLAGAAGHVLDLGAGPERSVAATKTYTASLAAVAALAAATTEDDSYRAQLPALPAALTAQLARTGDAAAAVDAIASWQQVTVVGRGAHYGTAFEAALKLRELTGMVAEAFSPADLLHGPIATTGPGRPLLAIAPDGPTLAGMRELLAVVRERGAPVAAIGHDPALGDPFLGLVDVPEWLAPVVAIVPAQLAAVGLAARRGVDDAAPFGLNKITKTR